MKTVTLINPESAKKIFSQRASKRYKNLISVLSGNKSSLLVNAVSCNGEPLVADKLKVKFGNTYYTYDLHESEENILVEIIDYSWGMGVLINGIVRLFFVFPSTEQKHFENFKNFGDIHILDFYENENISDLSFLAYCPNVRVLNLSECNKLKNISLLTNFKYLKILNLSGTKIKNLKPLENLSQLTNLNISSCNSLSDISDLQHLTALTYLNINRCQSLIDISSLKYLVNLKELNFEFDSFDSAAIRLDTELDFSCIQYLFNLEKLILSCHLFYNIDFLKELKNIKYLDLNSCENLSNIYGIKKLENITYLELSWTPIADISVLKKLKKLSHLFINETKVSDLAALSGLEYLYKLNLDGCQLIEHLDWLSNLNTINILNISDCENLKNLNGLKNLNNLEELYADSCSQLENIEGLKNLTNLKKINFDTCPKLKDISSIGSLQNLEKLYLSNCESILSFEPLQNLEKLYDLDLSSTMISDLTPVAKIKNLKKIDLGFCKNLTKVSPLAASKNLSHIELYDCDNIRDFNSLKALPQLVEIGWIEEIACLYVLMGSRNVRGADSSDFIDEPISFISLAKNTNDYVLELIIACQNIAKEEVRTEKLLKIVKALRDLSRPSESSEHRVSPKIWSFFIQTALKDTEQVFSSCLSNSLSGLDLPTECEPLLYTFLTELAELPAGQPNLVPWVRDFIGQVLTPIEASPEYARKIAPAAAVFYAGFGNPAKVRYWIDKGTSAQDPVWLDHIYLALIAFHLKKSEFGEAKAYLGSIQHSDTRDKAIAQMAEQMAAATPAEATDLLQGIAQEALRFEAAQKIAQVPEVLNDTQSIFRLLLVLEQQPEALALLIDKALQGSQGDAMAQTLRALLLPAPPTAASASALLHLAQSPKIAQTLSVLNIGTAFFEELQAEALSEQKALTAQLIERLIQKGALKPEFSEIISNAVQR